MDAFEEIVGKVFQRDGYWVQQSVKVKLTEEDKKKINKVKAPRWEIDLVAYKGKTNELLIIECKSYLDSLGVTVSAFDGSNAKFAERYKLFHNKKLRQIVFKRLIKQFSEAGTCPKNVKIKLCLVAGRIGSAQDREKLHRCFTKNGWQLYDEIWLKEKLKNISTVGYENSVMTITAKLLLRNYK